MTAKKMADIFFGKFSELISKDEIKTQEEIEVGEESSGEQNIDKKESKQKILIYSAAIVAATIVLFLIF